MSPFTWRAAPVTAGTCVVVDIDGVLADTAHREHHLTGRRKDWGAFFAEAGGDAPIEATLRLVDALAECHVPVLCTGRPDSLRDVTQRWLAEHGVRWELLAMRPAADRRPAPEVKADLLAAVRALGLDPVLALDDDARNVVMFEAAGVPCLGVTPPTGRSADPPPSATSGEAPR